MSERGVVSRLAVLGVESFSTVSSVPGRDCYQDTQGHFFVSWKPYETDDPMQRAADEALLGMQQALQDGFPKGSAEQQNIVAANYDQLINAEPARRGGLWLFAAHVRHPRQYRSARLIGMTVAPATLVAPELVRPVVQNMRGETEILPSDLYVSGHGLQQLMPRHR